MIITCESCSTQFQVDSARIPAQGIRVRCTICKHAFFVENQEAEEADPIERIVARTLAEEPEGAPDVSHDLEPAPNDRFETSFEAARSAVDELLGFSSPAPAPVERESQRAAVEPADPAAEPDEIVFDVEEELEASAPDAMDPIGREETGFEAPPPAPDAADPWDTPVPAEGPLEPETSPAPASADPWDTPVPAEGPLDPLPTGDTGPVGAWDGPPAEDLLGPGSVDASGGGAPWDAPSPFDALLDAAPTDERSSGPSGPEDLAERWSSPASIEAPDDPDDLSLDLDHDLEAAGSEADEWSEPASGAEAAASSDGLEDSSDSQVPWQESTWEEGWGTREDEAPREIGKQAAAEEEELPAADESSLEQGSEAAQEPSGGTGADDGLEAALALGWGGQTDTSGIELAGDPRRADDEAALEDWGLGLEEEFAGGSPRPHAREPVLDPRAIGLGASVAAPRASQLLAQVARLGAGAGWSVVAALSAVLLWATLAPRTEREAPARATVVAGLEASEVAVHWVENAFSGPLLVVRGELRNRGSVVRSAGERIAIRLLDAAGEPIDAAPVAAGLPLRPELLREAAPDALRAARDSASAALAASALAPGEGIAFEAVLFAVPDAARRVELAGGAGAGPPAADRRAAGGEG